ncbi:Glycerophosphoryl diester phosphodiesterase [Nonomuraea coxensis DSM 45129]|uniref:Glycerophosphoryl diester phosphodiesterase n=1 Tax=Nonomuraea coxensis DSM 45129 TaxID=1122611 RepID=A0ABX8U089_9ACTN|nr:glycerophosphodiester phosphodiesterase family protein [Nonomuraea coxensis]QYC41045.1 Glycerophosphoryl diester phosphodiesterase [Nonomuraea coxensis DSM 45129]
MYRSFGIVAAYLTGTVLLAGAAWASPASPPNRVNLTKPVRLASPNLASQANLMRPPRRPHFARAENIAHRAGSGQAPENTIVACARAGAAGADLCEFDVQQTKDQQLVLIHDETLARTTNVEQVFPNRRPWRVSDFTLAEIRRLDAGSWFSPRYRGTRVPTLGQALELLDKGGAGLLLEVKHSPRSPGIDRRVAAELLENKDLWQGRRLALQAFDWQAMRTLHRMVPDVPILLLGVNGKRLSEVGDYASALVLPQARLTERQVREVKAHGLRVYTGPTDRPRALRRLLSYGVDGIMTGVPARLRNVLRE